MANVIDIIDIIVVIATSLSPFFVSSHVIPATLAIVVDVTVATLNASSSPVVIARIARFQASPIDNGPLSGVA